MSYQHRQDDIWLYLVIGFLLLIGLAFLSFLSWLGITFGQFVNLVEVGAVTTAVVAIVMAAEFKKLEVIETLKGGFAAGATIGITSALVGSYIWLNYAISMWVSAAIGAVTTIAALHLGVIAFAAFIAWLDSRGDDEREENPPSDNRRKRENQSETTEAERVRQRYYQDERERERTKRYQ